MLFVPLAIVALAMLPRAIKTRNFYSYGLKIGIIFMLVFTALIPNPCIWGQQIYRRLDHRQLLMPSAPEVQALNATSNLWQYISTRYGGATPQTFKTWSIPTQTTRIFYYIRSIIDYEYDIDTNYVFDHVATPVEVLATGKDDCQGISCLLASLLLYMGYNAYVCECPFHWYVRVFYVDEGTNQTTYCDIWKGDTEPFFMFNEVETIFPRDIAWTINASFTFDYIPRKYLEIVNGTNGTLDLSVIGSSFPATDIPAWVAWVAIFGVCMLVGFLASVFVNIPNYKKLRWHEKIIPVIAFATPLFFGFYGIMLVPPMAFLSFALLMIGLAVFMLDIMLVVKSIVQAITRLYKRNDKL
ncbi:MAG: hypothetical protein Q6353_001175 [Candidatus Sigynarchaeum springense]